MVSEQMTNFCRSRWNALYYAEQSTLCIPLCDLRNSAFWQIQVRLFGCMAMKSIKRRGAEEAEELTFH